MKIHAKLSQPWRKLYISRHIGEISQMNVMRAAKRKPMTAAEGRRRYKRRKKTEKKARIIV